jgi:N-acyl-L-homoserine lactone synthetase
MKQTLLRIRQRYGLNLRDLAEAAQVDDEVVYAMLMDQPVTRDEAEQVLRGVEKITGVRYTLQDIVAHISTGC